ncbi:hypothetical protein AVEN_131815-1 [Araneus ventricosus]|uniref:Uncharacterized protein n=1 Tax=Araneus ventricosus TaxID=182803 RepID=A0A4Y2TQI2_ARAVE|nr:hypothetical protein AVEN_131815-1 [Araneus ventricosus]
MWVKDTVNSFHLRSRKKEEALKYADVDDYLRCLYATTKEQEDQILKNYPMKLLYAFMEWPMRNLFLETLENMWKYIGEIDFRTLMNSFLLSKSNWKDSDYYDLYENLWEKSPIHFRESVKKDLYYEGEIDIFFNEMRRKRKAHFDEQRNF